jgi:hypothetical protein
MRFPPFEGIFPDIFGGIFSATFQVSRARAQPIPRPIGTHILNANRRDLAQEILFENLTDVSHLMGEIPLKKNFVGISFPSLYVFSLYSALEQRSDSINSSKRASTRRRAQSAMENKDQINISLFQRGYSSQNQGLLENDCCFLMLTDRPKVPTNHPYQTGV